MLPPEYFDHAADDILELYSKLDETIIRDITRRLVKTGNVSATADWQIERLQQSGLLYEDIIRRVAEITDASEQQVQALFEDAGVEAISWDAQIYEAAGLSPLPIRQSPAALQVLIGGLQKTAGHLQNLTMTTAVTTQQAYINASALAEMQVESGAFDYATAIRNALKSAIGDGATVLYPSGHTDQLDVAVRRAVLTGVGQTAAQISLAYADDMGCDLVETTAHAGARPDHAAWQGKVFNRSGGHSEYPDFVKATGYGTGAGLCGWNCRHSFYPYFEGLSESAYPRRILDEYNNRTVTYNGKKLPYYDATQMQRGYERMLRAEKRKLSAYDEGIKTTDSEELRARLQEDFNSTSVKLKQQEAEMKDFLKQTGLDRQGNREQALGFSRSQAQKSVWVFQQNVLTNAAGTPIIKVSKTDIRGPKNGITQKTNKKGGIDRNYYDSDGLQTKQISNNDHDHKKESTLGEHGEHGHDYVLDEKGIPRHGPPRELNPDEREENKDIL